MTGVLLGVAWAGVVLAGGYRFRPLPRRLPAPGPTPHLRYVARTAGMPTAAQPGCTPLEALGRAVLGPTRRLRPSSAAPPPGIERRIGAVAVATLVAAVVLPVLVPVVLLGGWIWPRHQARRQERTRLARLEAGLPEAVDLLVLAVGAGANVSQAVAAAGRRGTGPLAAELLRVTEEVRRGRRVGDGLDELALRAGEAVRPLAAVLAASDRYGTLLGPALERLGDDVRRQRQRRAEEAARKVPVVMIFPLVLCILPAFALLTVAPLVAGALRALRL